MIVELHDVIKEINYFDTANVYQMGASEEVAGKLIREFGLDRDDIVVVRG